MLVSWTPSMAPAPALTQQGLEVHMSLSQHPYLVS